MNLLYTGIENIDNILQGIKPGELIMIAGRCVSGKTAFCLNVMLNILIHSKNKSVVFYSAEMPKEMIKIRCLSVLSGISLARIYDFQNGIKKQSAIYRKTANYFKQLNLDIQDCMEFTGSNAIEEIILSTYRKKEKNPKLSLIAIDYLGLLDWQYSKLQYINKRVEREMFLIQTCALLKSMAENLNISIIVIYQFPPARSDEAKKPINLSNLCSGIKRNIDKVIFLHRKRDIEDYNKIIQCTIWENSGNFVGQTDIFLEGKTYRIFSKNEKEKGD